MWQGSAPQTRQMGRRQGYHCLLSRTSRSFGDNATRVPAPRSRTAWLPVDAQCWFEDTLTGLKERIAWKYRRLHTIGCSLMVFLSSSPARQASESPPCARTGSRASRVSRSECGESVPSGDRFLRRCRRPHLAGPRAVSDSRRPGRCRLPPLKAKISAKSRRCCPGRRQA